MLINGLLWRQGNTALEKGRQSSVTHSFWFCLTPHQVLNTNAFTRSLPFPPLSKYMQGHSIIPAFFSAEFFIIFCCGRDQESVQRSRPASQVSTKSALIASIENCRWDGYTEGTCSAITINVLLLDKFLDSQSEKRVLAEWGIILKAGLKLTSSLIYLKRRRKIIEAILWGPHNICYRQSAFPLKHRIVSWLCIQLCQQVMFKIHLKVNLGSRYIFLLINLHNLFLYIIHPFICILIREHAKCQV